MAYTLILWRAKLGARDVVGLVSGVSTGRNMGPFSGSLGQRQGPVEPAPKRSPHQYLLALCHPAPAESSNHWLNWIECNCSCQNP